MITNEDSLIYETIKKRCKANGITVGQFCETANINRNSLANWKNKNPETVKTLRAIDSAFIKLETT